MNETYDYYPSHVIISRHLSAFNAHEFETAVETFMHDTFLKKENNDYFRFQCIHILSEYSLNFLNEKIKYN